MKSKILLGLGILLLFAIVACNSLAPQPFHSMAYGSEQYNTTDTGIMIVFYDKTEPNGGLYLWWCDLSADIVDNGDGTWDIHSPQFTATGVNQAIVDYNYYKYQVIEPVYDDEGFKLPQYMDDLGLELPDAGDLPHSQHIGKLLSVTPGIAKPAVVTRKWHGMSFNVSCLVSQTVVDMWTAGTLNVGDYVVVSFVDEHPNETEIDLAILVDKVYESWS